MIRIRAAKDGFRRCGMAFSAEWQEFPDNHFSREEVAILRAEKNLFVEVVQSQPQNIPEILDEPEDRKRKK
jgi:hypothetical protein